MRLRAHRPSLAACLLGLLSTTGTAAALELRIDAPAALEGPAVRLRRLDLEPLREALGRAGLEMPSTVRVTLVLEEDPRAAGVPPWIVGRAAASGEVVIFPARIATYPYDSLESVFGHELVHLALFERAGGHRLPRWFHEGTAVSVEAGWGIGSQLRLLLAALGEPPIGDVNRLFGAPTQRETTLAYLLAGMLMDDLRSRHGAGLPGAIADRVATGVPFARAFEAETGETPDAAARRAWAVYRRWTNWLPTLTSGTAVWGLILVLAVLAFGVRLRQRAARRRQLEEEEDWGA